MNPTFLKTEAPVTAFALANLKYLGIGSYLGIIFAKSNVASWYKIQEMFRFQSFHMYGIIGSALLVAMISVYLIKRYKVRTLEGESIVFCPKDKTYTRYILGGTLFGLGWSLAGSCPGPMVVLIGAGSSVWIAIFAAALLGTWIYGALRPKLPH